MIPMRQSNATSQNSLLVPDEDSGGPATTPTGAGPAGAAADMARPRRGRGGGNVAWLRRARQRHGIGEKGDVILLGGASVADFRVRVAQSHARHDMTPSYWSTVGLIADARTCIGVPLGGWDPSVVPGNNAIASTPMSEFDDADRYPNIAVVRFPGATRSVLDEVDALRTQRTIADLPALVVAWLGFVWGTPEGVNPLLEGMGHPGAVLVETAFGLVDVELTPGLAAAASCPEAIWQSVKWWQDFYTQAVAGMAADVEPTRATSPWGHYLIRQPQATYLDPDAPSA